MIKTFSFKLYNSKRNKKLHQQINLAGTIYNHCIALHKRCYRLFGKHLNCYQLEKHLVKLKHTQRYGFFSKLGSQAIQEIAERIDKAYQLLAYAP